jgi:acyl-CoA reductase-like NAD-dependent aldehyde dehydrogenase
MAQLAREAGIPAGVLNVVTGTGPVAGRALATHPLVDKISFTGSTAVGKDIVRLAADDLRRVTLELGGKSPTIILDDADLERAIPSAAMGIFLNTGQVCVAGSRLFVQRSIFERVVAGIEAIGRSMVIGNGLDAGTQLGPVISAVQRARVERHVEESRAGGADVIVAGTVPPLGGHFVAPVILANVDRSQRVMREEVFGPVVVATPFDDVEEAIAAANDTRYGLAAGVFTTNVSKAHAIAGRMQAGNVWVNCYGLTHPMLPFGGFKESGWGREFGADGLEAYRQKMSVAVAL